MDEPIQFSRVVGVLGNGAVGIDNAGRLAIGIVIGAYDIVFGNSIGRCFCLRRKKQSGNSVRIFNLRAIALDAQNFIAPKVIR